MRQHSSYHTKIVLRVAFFHPVGATAIGGKQEGAGRQHVQEWHRNSIHTHPLGAPNSRVGLQRSLVTRLGCSLLPNSTHRACSLRVQRQRIRSPRAGSALFPRGCKTQRASSKAPARTPRSGRHHRPPAPSGALPSAAPHTKFSRNIPLLTLTPVSWEKRVFWPRQGKNKRATCTQRHRGQGAQAGLALDSFAAHGVTG